MPIVRIGTKLVYYAHIPKCAGSSVEDYLRDRFGRLAMLDRRFALREPVDRWSFSSPQHIDWISLTRLFPEDFFSDVFTVVRHPLDRAVSAFRFQAEIEGTVPEDMEFGDWLRTEAEARKNDPHRSDNHSRPQTDFLPPANSGMACAIFHLEHGLDALVPYLDALARDQGGPRAMRHVIPGKRGDTLKKRPVIPGQEDIDLVAELYAADFERLGYEPGRKDPLTPPPTLDPEFLARAERARARASKPLFRLASRIRRRLQKWSD